MFAFSFLIVVITIIASIANKVGQYVFAHARLSSSGTNLLVERIRIATPHESELKAILVENGILKGDEAPDLETLHKTEAVISQLRLNEYEKAVTYIPEDMKAPFEALEIAWQIELLKIILRYAYAGIPPEETVLSSFFQLLGSKTDTLTEASDVNRLLELWRRVLPSDLFRFFHVEPGETLGLIEARLDQAFCDYLNTLSKDAETHISKKVYQKLLTALTDRNILLLARTKYSDESLEKVQPYLLNAEVGLESRTMKMLAEAPDYPRFLSILARSSYSDRLPRKEAPSPTELEEAFSRTLYEPTYTFLAREGYEDLDLRLMKLMDEGLEQLRKAAYSVILAGREVIG